MLTALSIRDVVLIERLDLEFGSGLGVLTGETGAGKSILLDALGLALGQRADARLVRHGCDQAVVTASFDVPMEHPANAILAEQSFDVEGTIIVRRTVNADGRSKVFVNDQPASVGLLKRLGDVLVEVQGQFDQHGLLDSGTHIDLLDEYGGLSGLRSACESAFEGWRSAERALRDAEDAARKAREDEEYLRFAADELAKFAPQPNEEEELSTARSLLQNAEKLVDAINSAYGMLAGNDGADGGIRSAQRVLERVADKAGGGLDEAIAALDRAGVELQEALSQLNIAASAMNPDERRLEDIEERLFALRDLARKHSVSPDDLPAVLENITNRLEMIDRGTEQIGDLKQKAACERKKYAEAAERLSIERAKAAKRLDDAVNGELAPLKLDKARFSTLCERLGDEHWTASGMDRVSFVVSTNPGTPPGPINKIASGGELSRFLLALKVSLAEVGGADTLVFDEVDSGVGGATAAAVGERLARLAATRQILVVTHSPQVASLGASHWRVAKAMNGERMTTAVTRLDDGQRLEEIARMLSGAEITVEARAQAKRLIEASGN